MGWLVDGATGPAAAPPGAAGTLDGGTRMLFACPCPPTYACRTALPRPGAYAYREKWSKESP